MPDFIVDAEGRAGIFGVFEEDGKMDAAITGVVPLDRLKGDSKADTGLLNKMAREAANYLRAFKWCGEIKEQCFGSGVGGVVAVFLFHILPNHKNVDEWLWVVVGDLPPAHLVTDKCRDPAAVLRTYIREMKKWIAAVEKGKSVENLIPVNAPATREYAEQLKTRITLLGSEILPIFEDAIKTNLHAPRKSNDR